MSDEQVPQKTVNFRHTGEQQAGGGYEGAAKTSRELWSWQPGLIEPNVSIDESKELADARSLDLINNMGVARGTLSIHKDSIVGARFKLNSQPNYQVLGSDRQWAAEFQKYVENKFNLLADADDAWFDVAGRNSLTSLVRLAVSSFLSFGEVVGLAEWLAHRGRPFGTAFQIINPSRLSNPQGGMDTQFMKRGVEIDRFGRAMAYNFRETFPNDTTALDNFKWKRVTAQTHWGRKKVLHIVEQIQPGEIRGISEMVSVLKQMRMTKNFQEIALQNAVIQATYAAAIESELPSEVVFSQLGSGHGQGINPMQNVLGSYMEALSSYMAGSKNIKIDGATIPHLFPGTKLNMQPLGKQSHMGSDVEVSMLRHVAAGLGLSYEQFARDYTKTNYSSARASAAETTKFMQARKKVVADKTANFLFQLWLEEEVQNSPDIPLPSGMQRRDFYDPIVRAALTKATWIGAGRGQIDEKKETSAAVERIKNNLSTLEIECARLGEDWREVLEQRLREKETMRDLGLLEEATEPESITNEEAAEEAAEEREGQ